MVRKKIYISRYLCYVVNKFKNKKSNDIGKDQALEKGVGFRLGL